MLTVLVTVFVYGACSASPLLNHKSISDLQSRVASSPSLEASPVDGVTQVPVGVDSPIVQVSRNPEVLIGPSPVIFEQPVVRASVSPNLVPIRSRCDFDFAKTDLCAKLDWISRQTDEEPGQFVLSFFSKQAPYLAVDLQSLEAKLSVKLWMSSMGHGSSPVTVQAYTDQNGQLIEGSYKVGNVYFSMPGEWEVIVALKKGTQILDQSEIKMQIE